MSVVVEKDGSVGATEKSGDRSGSIGKKHQESYDGGREYVSA